MHKSRALYTTTYGKLLINTQRILAFYANLKVYQFVNILRSSVKHRNYKQRIIRCLESRLDVILFRAGFVVSMRMARQFLNHGFVAIDGKKVNIPSFQMCEEHTLTVVPARKEEVLSLIKQAKRKVPNYIIIDKQDASIRLSIKNMPTVEKDLHMANRVSFGLAMQRFRI